MNYFTSDLHFGHFNAIGFDYRPFQTVEEMDKALIDNWNRKVTNEDTVYILGDFCFHSDKEPEYYLQQLKGKKYLVQGNHDQAIMKSEKAKSYFEGIDKMMYIKDQYLIVMCHFPIADWNKKRHGALHLYGHIHNRESDVARFMRSQKNAYNVGCMLHNYQPVTIDEIIAKH